MEDDSKSDNDDSVIQEIFTTQEFLKRRLLLLLDMEDSSSSSSDDESTSSEEESSVPKKRRRVRRKKPSPYESAWWDRLTPIRTTTSKYLLKQWIRKFRIPVELFDKIVKMFRDRGWAAEVQGKNAAGQPAHPFEMKLLGTLRYLGRGECWDTVSELTGESIG